MEIEYKNLKVTMIFVIIIIPCGGSCMYLYNSRHVCEAIDIVGRGTSFSWELGKEKVKKKNGKKNGLDL